MRHQKKGRKFGRVRKQRKALLKGLAFNLIMRGKIKTTLTRAKELKIKFDRLVTYGKKSKVEGFRLHVQPVIEAAKSRAKEELESF